MDTSDELTVAEEKLPPFLERGTAPMAPLEPPTDAPPSPSLPTLPRMGRAFARGLTRLTIELAAEYHRAQIMAHAAHREIWKKHCDVMQALYAHDLSRVSEATATGVKRLILFEFSRHLSLKACLPPDKELTSPTITHKVPFRLLYESGGSIDCGINSLYLTNGFSTDCASGGYCHCVFSGTFEIASHWDRATMDTLTDKDRSAWWWIHHFRHELQHIATHRWPKPDTSPTPPGVFYWLQSDELSCLAAQTALVCYIDGIPFSQWLTHRDFYSIFELKAWLTAFGRNDLPMGKRRGAKTLKIFQRMLKMHHQFLEDEFPQLSSVGCRDLLSLHRDLRRSVLGLNTSSLG